MRFIIAAGVVGLVFAGSFGWMAWVDAHPRYDVRLVQLDAYAVELPAHWPDPVKDDDVTAVRSAPNLQEGSPEQFRWTLSIFDEGTKASVDDVAASMRAGYEPTPSLEEVHLANGVQAKTWTVWVPRGELNQEHRGYVFKAPNGHVYSALQPMPPDWRTRRRYDNVFRAVLGSMRFKS